MPPVVSVSSLLPASGTAARVSALCLVALIALLLLRSVKPEWAPLLRLTAALLGGASLLSLIITILSEVLSLTGGALPEATWETLLRALGLALLTELCASLCRDSGEASLATCVEAAGKLEILLLALPLVRSVTETALSLLGA